MLSRTFVRSFHRSCTLFSDFSHVIIGGGVVGTAIGSEIQLQNDSNVLIVEQHEKLGMETTARNSEVIHAGIYYPKDSLKGQLCIRGKEKIYEAYDLGKFNSVQVPLQKCGKWVVAQSESEMEYLEKLRAHSNDVGVPVSLISNKVAAVKQPNIHVGFGALDSPTTGIISAHDLTLYFETIFENNEGTIALNTKLLDLQYNGSKRQYNLRLKDSEGNDFEVTSDNVINSAGLYAPKVSNMLLPAERHIKSYFAKGSYFGYQPETSLKVADKLIYPCPNANVAGLGVHLTFDLGGQFRFGPDLEWIDESIQDASELDYNVSIQNLEPAFNEIKKYFPHITIESLQPSYSGVRPKIFSAEESKTKFADFVIREETGFPGFINLLGIESPGLTSSWAIAEYIKDIYYK